MIQTRLRFGHLAEFRFCPINKKLKTFQVRILPQSLLLKIVSNSTILIKENANFVDFFIFLKYAMVTQRKQRSDADELDNFK